MLQKHFGRSLIDLNLLHFLMVTIKTTITTKLLIKITGIRLI